MKYIKVFEDFNGKLYKTCSSKSSNSHDNINFIDDDIRKIELELSEYPIGIHQFFNSGRTISSLYFQYYTDGKMLLNIRSEMYSDNWVYAVESNIGVNYQCDGVDGLIQLIKDKYEESKAV